ncbi:extracellular solute-binding protein [Ruminococcus bovis]|uniref:Extracellular solute-binding protein n=2 Tax=Oscillospiraceae TaxID=216572 RepID=A0A4P8XTZ1_9FIRM|nr:extracellular solute-binding protein [Ruminococcus bovis]
MRKGIFNMKKNIFSKAMTMVLLICILFSLVACSDDGEYITQGTNLVEEQTKNNNVVTIYTYVDPDNKDLHYDQDTKFYYPLLDMVHMYNNYCSLNNMGDYAVSVVKFSSRDRMIQQMSTEIMAGSGPDIIILDNELPISKLINQGAFADMNTLLKNDKSERKINLDDYDKTLMDTGVFKGKRYMMPMLIEPDIYISNSALFNDYDLATNTRLTYSNINEKLKKFANNSNNLSLTDSYSSSKEIILQYINDNINKEDYTTNFESKKFKSTIQSLKKLVKKSITDTKTTKDLSKSECLLSKGTTDEETGIYTPYNFSLSHMSSLSTDTFSYDKISDEQLQKYAEEYYSTYGYDHGKSQKENEKLFYDFVYGKEESSFTDMVSNSIQTTFISGITEKENQSRATISCGFMINNNSNKKEKAFEFIKYSLGERMQRFITFDSNYGDTYNVTVNKDALNNSISSFVYGGADFDEMKEQQSFMDKYASYINSINTYEIRDGYYNDKVIGSLVDDYLQDKISIDNFIANLNSKTKIYLYE